MINLLNENYTNQLNFTIESFKNNIIKLPKFSNKIICFISNRSNYTNSENSKNNSKHSQDILQYIPSNSFDNSPFLKNVKNKHEFSPKSQLFSPFKNYSFLFINGKKFK